jgi:hypothetical protein
MADSTRYTRRDALQLTAGGAAAMVFANPAAAADVPAGSGTLRFRDPIWNRDTFVKLQGNHDFEKQKVGWYAGKVMGIRDGEAVRELFGMEGFSVARLKRLPDGSWRKLLREVGFYRDLKTGQLMDHWDNVYTGERVRVVPIANDPFNVTFSEFFPSPPSYGGLNKAEAPKIPFILPWIEKGDRVLLTTDIHLFYPSALQPDKWPRESPGKMTRVSELFRYNISRSDLADESKKAISYFGVWNRVNPWLPWMLMDQAPGHVLYACDMGASDNFDIVAKDVLERARKLDPKWLEAPREDSGPSLSSLENFAITETPAPPRRK